MDEDDDDDDAVLADRASPSGKRWSSLAARLDLTFSPFTLLSFCRALVALDVPRTAHGECGVLLVQEPGAGHRCPLSRNGKRLKAEATYTSKSTTVFHLAELHEFTVEQFQI